MHNKDDNMPGHKKAKLDVLKALRQVAMELIKERSEESDEAPEQLQKVAVMAKDKEGLEKGLDKAKEVLEGLPQTSEDALETSENAEDSEDESELLEEPLDEEAALLQKLEELRNKKKQLKA